jgi:poly(A) polymerase
MLRAARFEAKLDFTIDPDVEAAIRELGGLLASAPAARLFDETLKLFLTGHGQRSFDALRRHGLFEVLYPDVERYLRRHPDGLVEQLLRAGLASTDARVAEGKTVTPTFLFTLLLYGPIAEHIERQPPQKWDEVATILDACDRAVHDAQRRVQIPRRFALGLREMFALQPRLEHPRGKRSLGLLGQSRFRAAYDLLLLRAQVGIALPEVAQWWTRLQQVGEEERLQMLAALEQRAGGSRRAAGRGGRPRRRSRRASPAAGE